MPARVCILALVLLMQIQAPTLGQTVWYVDDDAPLGGDGETWAASFRCLQDALHVASAGDEIRVAGGTYKPALDEAGLVTAGARTETLQLAGGIRVTTLRTRPCVSRSTVLPRRYSAHRCRAKRAGRASCS